MGRSLFEIITTILLSINSFRLSSVSSFMITSPQLIKPEKRMMIKGGYFLSNFSITQQLTLQYFLHTYSSRLKQSHFSQAKLSTKRFLITRSQIEDTKDDDDNISFKWESFDQRGKWVTINWEKTKLDTSNIHNSKKYKIAEPDDLHYCISPMDPSPVEKCIVRDRIVYIKRDDLLHLKHSHVSGNKARKMFSLNEIKIDDFPDAIVSYGGPQSNAMLAIAAIVASKNLELNRAELSEGNTEDENNNYLLEDDFWMKDTQEDEYNPLLGEDDDKLLEKDEGNNSIGPFFFHQTSKEKKKRFVYFTKKLPRYLRKQPNGNLLRALSLGMELMEISHNQYKELFGGENGGSSVPPENLEPPIPGGSLWIPQGGACGLGIPGAKLLAQEIIHFWSKCGKGAPLSVCIPGGTCTTATLVYREINNIIQTQKLDHLDIDVVVIPCVGDDLYALRQMRALDISLGGSGRENIPSILKPLESKQSKNGYYVFGDPAPGLLQTFQEMKDEHDIYVDLLYGAPAWTILLQHWKANLDDSPIANRHVMYVHSGGLEGVSSQLTRYKHKGLIESSQIQP